MKLLKSRLLDEYGMILVLLLLCLFFSVMTYREQSPTGAAAGRRLAKMIKAQFPDAPQTLIAVRDVAEDQQMVEQLRRDVEGSGGTIVGIIRGEPKAAREMLLGLANSKTRIDVIAGTQTTARWLIFEDVERDFPGVGKPVVIAPSNYYWPSFLKSDNLLNIANQIAIIAIVAIGMTMVIITGGVDLSVGSIIALSAVLSAKFIRDYGGGTESSAISMFLACLAAILACGLVGAFSGAMIARFEIPPFIVTLSMMLVASGLASTIAKNQSIYEIPASFVWLGLGADLFRLPNTVVLMLVLYALAHIFMSQMRPGRYLYAVGGNQEAARLSGVPVERVLVFAYTASSLLAALGGVIMASQFKSGSATYGTMYEMYVIAAVVVGGAPLSGGEGKMFATLIGAFTIAVIQNGMNLTNIESNAQRIVLGLLILGAVLIDRIRRA